MEIRFGLIARLFPLIVLGRRGWLPEFSHPLRRNWKRWAFTPDALWDTRLAICLMVYGAGAVLGFVALVAHVFNFRGVGPGSVGLVLLILVTGFIGLPLSGYLLLGSSQYAYELQLCLATMGIKWGKIPQNATVDQLSFLAHRGLQLLANKVKDREKFLATARQSAQYDAEKDKLGREYEEAFDAVQKFGLIPKSANYRVYFDTGAS